MRISHAVLIVLALNASPTIARADGTYREWINHCTTGAFQACFSLQVSFVHNVAPPNYPGGPPGLDWTTVDIRIANLQGRDGLPNAGAPLDRLVIHGLTDATGAGGGSGIVFPTPEGGAGPALPSAGGITEWFTLGPGDLVAIYSDLPGYIQIFGCDVPEGFAQEVQEGFPIGGWQTCSGWLHLTFTLYGTYSFADNSTVAIAGGGGSCNDIDECSMQVTPEPATVVLMGTGLLGMFLMTGFVRRHG